MSIRQNNVSAIRCYRAHLGGGTGGSCNCISGLELCIEVFQAKETAPLFPAVGQWGPAASGLELCVTTAQKQDCGPASLGPHLLIFTPPALDTLVLELFSFSECSTGFIAFAFRISRHAKCTWQGFINEITADFCYKEHKDLDTHMWFCCSLVSASFSNRFCMWGCFSQLSSCLQMLFSLAVSEICNQSPSFVLHD